MSNAKGKKEKVCSAGDDLGKGVGKSDLPRSVRGRTGSDDENKNSSPNFSTYEPSVPVSISSSTVSCFPDSDLIDPGYVLSTSRDPSTEFHCRESTAPYYGSIRSLACTHTASERRTRLVFCRNGDTVLGDGKWVRQFKAHPWLVEVEGR